MLFYDLFAGNRVSDEGVKSIANLLRENTTLHTLNLRCINVFHLYAKK